MPRTKIIGYAPDMASTTPGVIVDCNAVVPGVRGMEGAPGPVTGLLPALAAACTGAAALRLLDDTIRVFAGTSTALYEAGSSSYTDRTRAAGGAYAVAAGYRWSFAQFGNTSLAVNKADVLQFSTSGNDFANVTAPKASIVETAGQFVFLCDTNEGTYGDSPDRWWCSASGDYTDWVPSIATECTTGRLISAPGAIRAAKRFGEQIVIYKNRSMFIGSYQGSPEVWRFDEIPLSAGAASQEAVVNVGTIEYPRHIFMGMDDFYTFDGSRPIPIGNGWVKETVFNEWNPLFARAVCGVHDPQNSRVYFYYPASGGSLSKCVVYNYLTKKWGRDDRTVEMAFDYFSPGVSYDGLGTLYSTYADFPNLTYDSSFFSTGASAPAFFNASHVIQTLNGPSTSSYLTLGDMGDEEMHNLITRLRPIFLQKPTSATLINYYRENLGDSLTTDATTTFGSGKFDFLREARWHRFTMNLVGDWEMPEVNIYATPGGEG